MFKYQATFAADLATKWRTGNHNEVRNVIRNLKNKAQAAYIAARVSRVLDEGASWQFIDFLDPNNL